MLGLLKIVMSKVQRVYYQFSLTVMLDVRLRIQAIKYGYEIQGHCQIIDESEYIVFEHFLLSGHHFFFCCGAATQRGSWPLHS
jgi:hypothetical protein